MQTDDSCVYSTNARSKKWSTAFYMKHISELLGVTCLLKQLNVFRLNPASWVGTRLTYPEGIEG